LLQYNSIGSSISAVLTNVTDTTELVQKLYVEAFVLARATTWVSKNTQISRQKILKIQISTINLQASEIDNSMLQKTQVLLNLAKVSRNREKT